MITNTYSLLPLLVPNNDDIFEKAMQNILMMTNSIVLTDTDIKQKYGNKITNISFLLYKDNTIYAFQNKVGNIRITYEQINNFRYCLQEIFKIEKINCIGIFISKNPIIKSALNILNDINYANNIKY